MKQPKLLLANDGPGKPEGINKDWKRIFPGD